MAPAAGAPVNTAWFSRQTREEETGQEHAAEGFDGRQQLQRRGGLGDVPIAQGHEGDDAEIEERPRWPWVTDSGARK
jgi:hypothetical protein